VAHFAHQSNRFIAFTDWFWQLVVPWPAGAAIVIGCLLILSNRRRASTILIAILFSLGLSGLHWLAIREGIAMI